MNMMIVNGAVQVLFRASLLYLLLKIVKDVKTVYYYAFKDEELNQYGRIVLTVELLLTIMICVCVFIVGLWFYQTFDIELVINTSDVIGVL